MNRDSFVTIDDMFLPRFSLRTSLGLTLVAAFYFFALALAAAGRPWAVCVAVGVGVVGFALLVHACMFAIGNLFSRIFGIEQIVVRSSQGGVLHDQQNPPVQGQD
jgi:hypothetical protein